MSRDPDRIPVGPGRRTPTDVASSAADADARTADMDALDPLDVRAGITPAQAAVGFGVLASLILLILGRRRRRPRDRD